MDGEQADRPADQMSQRTGTADRQAAVDALGEHARAGRLTAQEYEDRSESAKRAVTWGDVDRLFADLPPPHPRPASRATHRIEPVAAQQSSRMAEERDSRAGDAEVRHGLVPQHVGNWLMALTPPLALILFFAFGTWWFFLLIPLVSMVVYGPGERHR